MTVTLPDTHTRWPATLAEALCPGQTPRWMLCTGSRVDSGRWWWRQRIWLCLYDDVLLLLADGPRPLCQRLERGALMGTTYNHVTGRLLLAGSLNQNSDRPEPVAALAMGPIDAQRVLRWLRCKETSHA